MNSFRTNIDGEVRFKIPPNSPCPCGSGKPASRCCLTVSGFRKAPASAAPLPPKTGKSLQACYAARLTDCSSKVSREHYISESLLHYLNCSKDLRVSGLPWIEGEEKILPPDALAAKILCERHNSSLSPLDAISVHLFQAFDEEGVAGSGQQLLHLFCGHDLERWLLKILCGMLYSKNLKPDNDGNLSISRQWLEILFGYTDFPDGQGLYVCTTIGHRLDGPRGLMLRAITERGGLTGMGLWVCGYEFILSMSGFPSRRFDGRKVVYRPLEFYTTGPNFEKSVLLSWNGVADLGTVHLVITD